MLSISCKKEAGSVSTK